MPATCFEPTTQGSCQPPSFRANSFRLIHFPQNASANPLESHTFKTKDLKSFSFIHFQKSGGGAPNFAFRVSSFGRSVPRASLRVLCASAIIVCSAKGNL